MASAIIGLLGLASPFIVQYIQSKSAEIQAAAKHQQEEMDKANQIANEISHVMDDLVFFTTEVMYGIVLRGKETATGTLPEFKERLPFEPDRQAWEKYRENLISWEGSKTRYRAQLERYFGPEALELLKTIQADTEQLRRYVHAAFFMRKDSQDYIDKNSYKTKFFPVKDRLENAMTQLSQLIITRIQERTIGHAPVPMPAAHSPTASPVKNSA